MASLSFCDGCQHPCDDLSKGRVELATGVSWSQPWVRHFALCPECDKKLRRLVTFDAAQAVKRAA